jgi:hypothetical protein
MKGHEMGFFKSSFCNADSGQCVEVELSAGVNGNVMVCNSKDRGSSIEFTQEEWTTFIQGVKSGEFDPKTTQTPA